MPKRRSVLMLVENLPVPRDRRVWAEATALRDRGFHVSVICPKGPGEQRAAYTWLDGIHIYRYALPALGCGCLSYVVEYGLALLMTYRLSLKVWRQVHFDVIHTANPPDLFFLIALLYRFRGVKFVFDQHDLAPEIFGVRFGDRMRWIRAVLGWLERCSYRVADVVVVTNLSQQRRAIVRGRCSADSVFVVRNGPQLDRIRPVAVEPELKRGRRYLLAYVGVMGVQDGVDYALLALQELVHTHGRRDVSLVLMGDGGMLPRLRTLARTLRLDDYVHFTGWLPTEDIVRYLSAADIGLSPDPRNGLNEWSTMIKTMEYMAMGKPAVAFDLTETRYSAADAALYATPNDVGEYARLIATLLDDPELRLQLGAAGRSRVEEALSWEYARDQLLNAYDYLFGAPRARALDEVQQRGRLSSLSA
jgi:glycosyltransferase involved in cell wall biosynthesis